MRFHRDSPRGRAAANATAASGAPRHGWGNTGIVMHSHRQRHDTGASGWVQGRAVCVCHALIYLARGVAARQRAKSMVAAPFLAGCARGWLHKRGSVTGHAASAYARAHWRHGSRAWCGTRTQCAPQRGALHNAVRSAARNNSSRHKPGYKQAVQPSTRTDATRVFTTKLPRWQVYVGLPRTREVGLWNTLGVAGACATRFNVATGVKN